MKILNLKLAFRNLTRNRLYFFFNLAGLSMALAIAYLVTSFALQEYSYDKNYENIKRIGRLVIEKPDFEWSEPRSSWPIYEYIKTKLPGIEKNCVTINLRGGGILREGKENLTLSSAMCTNPAYFDIFTPTFLAGNPETALSDPQSIVLTKSLAEKLGVGLDEIGKTLQFVTRGTGEIGVKVSGIIEDLPKTTTVYAESILPLNIYFRSMSNNPYYNDIRTNYHKDFFRGYILLSENSSFEAMEENLAGLQQALHPEINQHYHIQKLSDAYMHSDHLVNAGRKGDIKLVRIFLLTGLLVLIIAISNYIILSVGASIRRTSEIGVKKTFGARSNMIRTNILSESILISLLVLPLAFALADQGAAAVEKAFGLAMGLNPGQSFWLSMLILLITILTGVVSGLYLSQVLSRISPLDLLNAKAQKRNRLLLQRGLIGVQLLIFAILISSAQIVFKQLKYARDIDKGYSTDHLITGSFFSIETEDFEGLRSELLRSPAIEDVCFGGLLPPSQSFMTSRLTPIGSEQTIEVESISADFRFFDIMDFTLLQGRQLDPSFGSDSGNIMVNETFVKDMNIEDPVGHVIEDYGTIVGVTKDFFLHSIHKQISPMAIHIAKNRHMGETLIKYREGMEDEALAYSKKIFQQYRPSYLRLRTFPEAIDAMYGKEIRFGRISIYLTIFTFIIAVMGLFGMSLFLSNERRFETAVRKTQGAQTGELIRKMSLSYWKILLISNLISVPLIWYLMSEWLNGFAYHIGIPVMAFLISFLVSVLIVLVTTIWNTARLSRINPAANLRYL